MYSVIVWTLLLIVEVAFATPSKANSTFFNPILPGWHSDPSCVFVPEEDHTFFCLTSTFLVTPGIPIYASKDLVNWKLASHAFNRRSQFPRMNESSDQNDGIFAVTLRYHEGVFYAITVYSYRTGEGIFGLIFNTTDPYSNDAWSEPVAYDASGIDPDLFWHNNGKVYMASSGTILQTIDLSTGVVSAPVSIWNGTGGAYPEGPHIYHKDDYYYLMIGEGGTETNHSETIARSRNIDGPYESYEGNPILTARRTTNYFQTVGHADLFQDGNENWWAVALSTRSGPEWANYPMGRETVLTPVTWKEGEWPVVDSVHGEQRGWPLPKPNKKIGGSGPFLGDPDVVDFEPGSKLPAHFVTWRWPQDGTFAVSPPGHPNSLRLKPSKTVTPTDEDPLAGANGLSLLMRVQTDTLFTYTVDLSFNPKVLDEEAGVTIFLTQRQHLDLGVVMLPSSNNSLKLEPKLRFRTTGAGTTVGSLPQPVVKSIPEPWLKHPITLQIQAKNDTHYTFSVASIRDRGTTHVIGVAPATIVSGGTGPFTGSLVGVYATSNNGSGTTESYISRWRYTGDGQKIDYNRIVESKK
ncbi:glycoside hydrolase family 43 protein [Zopfia rhizophila CBS 207.26]|uniref:Glycoside hydrolase family 43 protein n=1 Tax=Zopfia rhizophila CBS 207.26 TaxID=1314779 RepID=A0A6A6DW09_9PEZI|nr:glycoside hydrolase family 43 protein [Zopfia rhizophila CBS 207.26]